MSLLFTRTRQKDVLSGGVYCMYALVAKTTEPIPIRNKNKNDLRVCSQLSLINHRVGRTFNELIPDTVGKKGNDMA